MERKERILWFFLKRDRRKVRKMNQLSEEVVVFIVDKEVKRSFNFTVSTFKGRTRGI